MKIDKGQEFVKKLLLLKIYLQKENKFIKTNYYYFGY
jgi:hypothetical protein